MSPRPALPTRTVTAPLLGSRIDENLSYADEPVFEQGVTQYPPNGHLALIRQFAHEVQCTANHYGWV